MTTGVDIDWDDEDEATHIFDKADEPTKTNTPAPAAGVIAPPIVRPVLAGSTQAFPQSFGQAHAQALPPPPFGASQPPRFPAPPPPMPGSAAMRAGGTLAMPGQGIFPSPSTGSLPPPPNTHPGLGAPQYRPPSVAPPPFQPSSAPPPTTLTNPPSIPSPVSSRPSGFGDFALPHHRSAEATAVLRPRAKRTGLFAMIGVAAALVIGVVAVFAMSPHAGRVVINVNDPKGSAVNRVEIFVDGRKQCDTAPCIVDQVSTGSHDIKVLADGYDIPPVQQVQVDGHKDATVSFAIGSSRGTGIKVSGNQAGVKLYLDDKEIGPLPQDVRDLTPGDHVVKVAGSDRYQPLEKHVSVDKDQVDDLGTVTLKVVRGNATISLATPGARVYLVSGADRRELPVLPISVDIDTTKTWSLEASKAGYNDYHAPVRFDDGQAEKNYSVVLDPKGAAVVAYAPGPAQAVAPAPAPAAAPANEAAGGGDGFLNINSIPPSTCFLDGRSLGSTPRLHVAVKPGSHSVKFVNSDQGLSKNISVSVGAGETKPAVAKLN